MSAGCHLPLLLASIVIASASTQAQEARVNGSLTPIELKLKATSDKACVDSFVPLELKVTNNANSDMEIRELDLFRNYDIEFTTDDGSRGPGAGLLLAPGTKSEEERLRNEIHILKPDESYTTTFIFSLSGRRAFPKPGRYSLKTYYKQLAASNSVSFEIINCKSN